jgi:hypothetical protein
MLGRGKREALEGQAPACPRGASQILWRTIARWRHLLEPAAGKRELARDAVPLQRWRENERPLPCPVRAWP